MSRTKLNDSFYFITNSTFLKKPLFNADGKKEILLKQFKHIKDKYKIPFCAYSIADDHYHILIYLKYYNLLSKTMQLLHGRSSYYLNKIEKVERSIWSNYWSIIIENDDAFYRVLGYIIGNPLKHNIVKNFAELEKYKYCSFKQTKDKIGLDLAIDLIGDVIELDFEEERSFNNWTCAH